MSEFLHSKFFVISIVVIIGIVLGVLTPSPVPANERLDHSALTQSDTLAFSVRDLMVCGLHTDDQIRAVQGAIAWVSKSEGWKTFLTDGSCEKASGGVAITTGYVVRSKNLTKDFCVVQVTISGKIAYVIVPIPGQQQKLETKRLVQNWTPHPGVLSLFH